ncbi:MAG TPA: tetratricopeptide repeat protein [Candidatus Cloacimonadota bacterium]|nr:tetratricopeptide repeat protein [Candidatus Cloacimonadota bacterium]
MKATKFIVLLLSLILWVSCSAYKKQAPKEPVKTPQQLAVETAKDAETAYSNGDYEGAITHYNTAIDYYKQALPTAAPTDSIPLMIFRLNKNIANIYSIYGYELSTNEDYEGAIIQYEKAIAKYKELQPEASPRDSVDTILYNLYQNTAVACRDAGEYDKAIAYYDLMLAAHPENDEILLKKFAIYKDDLKNETQAYEILKEYAISNNDFGACHRLGDLYRENNDFTNAIYWYEKADSIKTDSNVLIKLGNLYRSNQIKAWDKSNKVFERYIALNPMSPDLKTIYKLMGGNYDQMKNKAKATEYFEKYLNIEYAEDIALYVCQYYFNAKNYGKAITWANTILEKNPANSDALYFRAVSKYSQKDMKGAKADFQRLSTDTKYGSYAKQYLKSM